MAKLVKVNGDIITVTPRKGKVFSSDELHEFVGGYIEVISQPNGEFLICDEEGKLKNKPINRKASIIWAEHYGPTDVIVGDVVICGKDEIN